MSAGELLEDGAELAVRAGVASVPQIRQAKIVIAAIGLAIGALLLGALFYWFFIRPQNLAADAAKSKGEAAIARHTAAAGETALKIVDDTRQAHAAVDATTERNDHAIKSAVGADTPIPGVARALHDALCMRRAYQSEPDCVAMRPAPRGDASPRADAGGDQADER